MNTLNRGDGMSEITAERCDVISGGRLQTIVDGLVAAGPLRLSRPERMEIARALRNLAAGIREVEGGLGHKDRCIGMSANELHHLHNTLRGVGP